MQVGGVAGDRVAETEIRNYAPLNMRFVDGSILQDIPHTEMQTLFNVKSFVVSQVNPHFSPFIQDPSSYKGGQRLFAVILHHLWTYVALDVRNRYARLLLLSLVPKIKGQDVSPFLMQVSPSTHTHTYTLTKALFTHSFASER